MFFGRVEEEIVNKEKDRVGAHSEAPCTSDGVCVNPGEPLGEESVNEFKSLVSTNPEIEFYDKGIDAFAACVYKYGIKNMRQVLTKNEERTSSSYR